MAPSECLKIIENCRCFNRFTPIVCAIWHQWSVPYGTDELQAALAQKSKLVRPEDLPKDPETKNSPPPPATEGHQVPP